MKLHYESTDSNIKIYQGDCIEVMRSLKAESIDSIVTDPPYGLSFMGKGWDHQVPGKEYWVEALRVAKPGAHLLAFGGTRLYHRLTCAIEDAGWEIRDCLMWLYGSGFPKSHDVSKAIDKQNGVNTSDDMRWKPEPHFITGAYKTASGTSQQIGQAKPGLRHVYIPSTAAATKWNGWGTALKPAWEPIVLARKPIQGTVAKNVLEHGTGAINIDECRIGSEVIRTIGGKTGGNAYGDYAKRIDADHIGRWPANLFLEDGLERAEWTRYFYCPKASKKDRGEGNTHPTVKPTELIRYLCRLVTPPGGVVLDPFFGSGSTGKAAALEGFGCTGIEMDAQYCEIATQRCSRYYCKAISARRSQRLSRATRP